MSARLEHAEEHRQFREMVRDFVQQTVVPSHEQWEHAGCLDRSLFAEAGKLGLLAFSVPEEFGGAGVDDFRYNAIVVEELQRAGAAAEAKERLSAPLFPAYRTLNSCSPSWRPKSTLHGPISTTASPSTWTPA